MLSRRAFLIGTSALVAAPALPAIAIPAPVVTAARAAAPMWAVGTPGEYDWQAVRAATPEKAFKIWMREQDWDAEDEMEFDPTFVTRVEQWDSLTKVNPADWIEAGMGHCCDRCSYETHPSTGARVVGGEVVCEECLTIPDLLEGDEYDRETAEERIAQWMIGHDCDEASVRKQMSSSFDPDLIPTDIWQKCLAEARANL